VPFAAWGARDARGIGLHDLVEAIETNRAPRASGELAHHVVDIARSILAAAAEVRTVEVGTSVERPEPMPVPAQPRSSAGR
jgi:predicted dehydrogenase